jgi:hypothetical protein
MKKSQTKYDLNIHSKKFLIAKRSTRASGRTETYKFVNRRKDLQLSYELRGNLVLKREFYSSTSDDSVWTDRTSRVAAPFGSELFLKNERHMPENVLGCPRYYFHELNQNDNIPDARARYPYDKVAHSAARSIVGLFRTNLNRRHKAATIIQKAFKYFIKCKQTKRQQMMVDHCIRRIQYFFRVYKVRFKRNARRLRSEYEEILRKARTQDDYARALLEKKRNDFRINHAYLRLTRL